MALTASSVEAQFTRFEHQNEGLTEIPAKVCGGARGAWQHV